jgi:hypothetical protein
MSRFIRFMRMAGMPTERHGMKLPALAMLSALAWLCGGCASIPKFAGGAGALPPRVSDITDKIQCEIIEALHSAKYDPNSDVSVLAIYPHVVSVSLTLEVTDTEAVNPSLSYINPYATSGTNFTALLGGQWSGTQDRNYSQLFNLIFDLGDETPEKWNACTRKKAAGGGLRGDLGIRDVLTSGLRYEAADSGGYKLRVLGLSPDDAQDPLTNSAALSPSFGSTINFTIVYGMNGGPNWTLTHFTGPSSTGLLSYNRTLKDSLILSFARVVSSHQTKESDREATRAAGRAARENVTNQLLQRILLFP